MYKVQDYDSASFPQHCSVICEG